VNVHLRYSECTGLERTHADPAAGPEPIEYQIFCVVSIGQSILLTGGSVMYRWYEIQEEIQH